MKIQYVIAAVTIAVTGCSVLSLNSPIDWDDKLSSINEIDYIRKWEDLISKQVLIESRVGPLRTTGMGVALSPNTIATVAHVISPLTVGDEVSVVYTKRMLEKGKSYAARVTRLDPLHEVAVVELIDDTLPDTAVPVFCSTPAVGNVATVAKEIYSNDQLTGGSVSVGVITGMNYLPKVSNAYNKMASFHGHPPVEMEGQARLVILSLSSVQGGHSGGAVYDHQGNCVAGLVSMKANISDFENPQSVDAMLGNPKHSFPGHNEVVLFSIPITQFLEK